MTPAHLAAYIARGPAVLPSFALPAVLDALKAERAATWAQRDHPKPGERHPIHAVNRLDAAIAEIEYTLNPCPDTAAECRHTAERVAWDVLALVEKTTETP